MRDWRPAALGAAPVIAALVWVAARGPERAPSASRPIAGSSSAASLPDAAIVGRTTVIVYDDGRPAPGRRVVFHANDGTVLHTIESGQDGKANGPVSEGAMITVAYGTSIRQLVTVAGVLPNEEVLVGEEEDEGGVADALCTAMISMPALPPDAVKGVVTLGVGTTEATNDGKPLPMNVLARYLEGGPHGKRFRVLAEAVDTQGNGVAWSHGWGEGCSRDAGPVAVKLADWKKDYRPFAMMLSNVGDAVTMHVEASILRGEDDRYLRRKHELRPPYGKEVRFDLPPAVLSEQTSLAYRIELYSTSPHDWKGGPIDRTVLAQRMAPTATPPETIALDLGSGMLPRVTHPALETTSDAARPFVSFRIPSREGSDAATTDADAAIVRLTWPRTREHSWTIVLPPNGPRRIRLPALPDVLAQWRPDGRDTSVSVGLVDASEYASFADVRKKGLAPLGELDEGATLRWAISGDQDF